MSDRTDNPFECIYCIFLRSSCLSIYLHNCVSRCLFGCLYGMSKCFNYLTAHADMPSVCLDGRVVVFTICFAVYTVYPPDCCLESQPGCFHILSDHLHFLFSCLDCLSGYLESLSGNVHCISGCLDIRWSV